MSKTRYLYTAYTGNTTLLTQEHEGSMTGARRKAIAYARQGLPDQGWQAFIKIADSQGREMLRERLK